MTAIVKQNEFSTAIAQNSAETSMAAVAAREQAAIQAAYIMAERHPRNWDNVRVRMMQHCSRTRFAAVSMYSKPVGREYVNGEWIEKKAVGLSTQWAQVARQEMANVAADTRIVYEDEKMRIVRAYVVDLERNAHESREIVLHKTVEKKGFKNKKTNEYQPPDGRDVIGQRINSKGEVTYICVATEDELLRRQNADISKAHRDCTLRLIPKDIRDEAEELIREVLVKEIEQDPTAYRKKIIDSFAKLGVMPDDLVNYLQSPLDRASPAQIEELRDLYSAINENEITFQGALRLKFAPAEQTKTTDEVVTEKVESLKTEQQRIDEEHSRLLKEHLAKEKAEEDKRK